MITAKLLDVISIDFYIYLNYLNIVEKSDKCLLNSWITKLSTVLIPYNNCKSNKSLRLYACKYKFKTTVSLIAIRLKSFKKIILRRKNYLDY